MAMSRRLTPFLQATCLPGHRSTSQAIFYPWQNVGLTSLANCTVVGPTLATNVGPVLGIDIGLMWACVGTRCRPVHRGRRCRVHAARGLTKARHHISVDLPTAVGRLRTFLASIALLFFFLFFVRVLTKRINCFSGVLMRVVFNVNGQFIEAFNSI